MADLDVTQKTQIYNTLAQLNSAFSTIVGCYQSLRETRIIHAGSMREHVDFAQEAQSDFNQQFLMALQDIEMSDCSRFGRTRHAMEKEIRDPDDVFIHAAERRAELKKQRKRARNRSASRSQAAHKP
jgi:hypothetical protein